MDKMLFDRAAGRYAAQQEPSQALLRFLYGTVCGRAMLKAAFSRPWFSRMAAMRYYSRLSALRIDGFVKKYGVDLSDCPDKNFRSFNDFFTRRVVRACRRHSGEISDIGRLSSLEPVRAMNRLALIAASHGLDSPAYQRGKKSYINKYGDRALRELKLETVTMRTDPSILDDAVRQRMSAGSAGEAISGAAKKADAWTVRRAKLGIEGRESARLNRSRIYGIAREIFLRLGDNFADRGIIDERDDIFMSSWGPWPTPPNITPLRSFRYFP